MPKIVSKKSVLLLLTILVFFGIGYYAYALYKQSQDIIPIDREIAGDNFIKELKYSEAVSQYKIYLTNNDKNSSGYLKLSEIYWNKNLATEAIDLLKVCKEKCSFNSSALSRLAKYALLIKDYDTAYNALEDLSKQIGSDDKITKNNIAVLKLHILNSQNKNEEAINFAKTFIDENSSSDPHLNFFISVSSYTDITQAKRYLTNYADYMNNKYFVELNNLLDNIQKDGQNTNINTSLANLSRLLVIYSFDQEYFVNLLSEQIQIPYYNYYPLSTTLLDKVISNSPDYYATYQLRGITKFFHSDFVGAETDFVKALQLEPTDKLSLLYLARIYDKNSNPQKSITYYKSILDVTQNDTSILKEYAEVLKNYGFYTQSAEKYKELIKLAGQNKSNFIHIVDYTNLLVFNLNRFEEVEPLLNSILNQWESKAKWSQEERPDLYKQIDFNAWYSNYQLKLASIKGKFDNNKNPLENIDFYNSQLKLLQVLDERYPDDVKITYNIALLEIQIGKLEEVKENSDQKLQSATEHFKKVINLDLTNEYTSNAKEKIESLKNN